jgi:hypothetical protein
MKNFIFINNKVKDEFEIIMKKNFVKRKGLNLIYYYYCYINFFMFSKVVLLMKSICWFTTSSKYLLTLAHLPS